MVDVIAQLAIAASLLKSLSYFSYLFSTFATVPPNNSKGVISLHWRVKNSGRGAYRGVAVIGCPILLYA
jgi:hypothetical protein